MHFYLYWAYNKVNCSNVAFRAPLKNSLKAATSESKYKWTCLF